mmetsp:Transcript_18462/g.38458  ORF Transcript_18462/g.38458 Transcript_18462/m.38458 type:complete len:231 (-) Transcript_18462:807-1499(-)
MTWDLNKVASTLALICCSSNSSPDWATSFFKLAICSSISSGATLIFSILAISSTAMDALRSLSIPPRATSLYFSKFSGVTSFLISASGVPLSLISVSMTAYFSRHCIVMRVSGTTISIFSARAFSRAVLRAAVNTLASSESTAVLISSMRPSLVRPGRIALANSSSSSGRVLVSTDKMVTSKIAVLPASVLSLRKGGKVTLTSRTSSTLAPIMPSTKPSMYFPVSMTTST